MKRASSAYLTLPLVAVIWGASFGINRMATDALHPLLFMLFRFGLAVPLLFLLLKVTEGSVGVAPRDALVLALIGLFGVTGMENILLYAIRYTSLANASLLNVAPWPIFTALFAPFFTRERITTRLVVGGALAMGGVCMIVLGGGQTGTLPANHLLGDGLALLTSLIGALYNLACMPLMQRYSPLRVSTWFIFFGVLFTLPLSSSLWSQVAWGSLGAPVWLAIAYNTVLCTVAAFIIWNQGMNDIGAARANFFRYLVPGSAVLAGYLMYHETVALWQGIGGLLIALGLIWITLEKKESPTAAA